MRPKYAYARRKFTMSTNHEERIREYNLAMNKAIKELCDFNPGTVWANTKDPTGAPPYWIVSKRKPKDLVLPQGCVLYYDSLALSDFPDMRYCSPIFVDESIRPYETLWGTVIWPKGMYPSLSERREFF